MLSARKQRLMRAGSDQSNDVRALKSSSLKGKTLAIGSVHRSQLTANRFAVSPGKMMSPGRLQPEGSSAQMDITSFVQVKERYKTVTAHNDGKDSAFGARQKQHSPTLTAAKESSGMQIVQMSLDLKKPDRQGVRLKKYLRKLTKSVNQKLESPEYRQE